MDIFKKLFKRRKEIKKAPHLELGEKGEAEACKYLKKKRYKILEKCFSCKLGEIDIIAKDEASLCFIEVKCRSSNSFGHPEEAITWEKKRRIKKVAEYYMLLHKITNVNCRYDVVAILETKEGKRKINLIKNAF